MDASGTAGSPVFTSYDATAFTSYHQPSPATMKPMSRICGSPAVGQYTSLRMPWPTVAQTRPEPRPVVTASFGPGAITGLTGIPGVGALDISDLLMASNNTMTGKEKCEPAAGCISTRWTPSPPVRAPDSSPVP